MIVLWIALAGAVGALVRFGVTLALPARSARTFPLGILFVNVAGSLVAGVTLGFVVADVVPADVALIVWAGLCGGLTTFSTFAVDTVTRLRTAPSIAWANVIVTVVLSLAAAWLGFALVTMALGS